MKLSSPELLLPYEALAWLEADQRHYSESFSELTTLLQKLRGDDPAEAPVFDDNARRVVVFAARIREFAVTIPDSSRQPPATSQSQLDKSVAAFGDEAVAIYEAARTSVTDKVTDYDTQLVAAKGTNQATLIELERKRIEKYVTFDATAARQAIVARLDED